MALGLTSPAVRPPERNIPQTGDQEIAGGCRCARLMTRNVLSRVVVVLVIVLASFAAAAGPGSSRRRGRGTSRTRAPRPRPPRSCSQLAAVVVSLEGFRGLVEGGGGIDADTFEPFAAYALEARGGLLAAWIPRVTEAERGRFERVEGTPIVNQAGATTVPAVRRAEYFPVTLTEPRALGRALIGLDVGASVVGKTIIAAARDTGLTRMSEPAPLPGEGSVIILVRAVYGNLQVQNSIASRRAAFSGVVATANRLGDIGDGVLAELPVRHGDRDPRGWTGDPAGPRVAGGRERGAVRHRRAHLDRAGGRRARGASFVLPATVLGAGLVLAALVWLLMSASARREADAERAADELERRVPSAPRELAAANQRAGGLQLLGVARPARAAARDRRLQPGAARGLRATARTTEARRYLRPRPRRRRSAWAQLIDDLLALSRVSARGAAAASRVDLERASRARGGRRAARREPDARASSRRDRAGPARPTATRACCASSLENLLGNAWKFTAQAAAARASRSARRQRGRRASSTSCATTAPASTWPTPTSCSAPSSGCTTPTSSRAPASAWRPCSASSTATAARIWAEGAVGRGRDVLLHPATRGRPNDAEHARSCWSRTTPTTRSSPCARSGSTASPTRSWSSRDGVEALDYLFGTGATPARAGDLPVGRPARPQAAEARRARGAAADARRRAHAAAAGRHADLVQRGARTSSRATSSAPTATCASRWTSTQFVEAVRQLGLYWLVLNQLRRPEESLERDRPPAARAARRGLRGRRAAGAAS